MLDINALVITGTQLLLAIECTSTIVIKLSPEHLARSFIVLNALPLYTVSCTVIRCT